MESVVVLDTHVFLWALIAPGRISRKAKQALSKARRRVIADITLREIALLVAARRLEVEEPLAEWLDEAVAELGAEVLGIDSRIAARSIRVAANFHDDPADQLIAATAIELGAPLITADERLLSSPALRSIW